MRAGPGNGGGSQPKKSQACIEKFAKTHGGIVNIVQNLLKFIMQMKEALVREAWALGWAGICG